MKRLHWGSGTIGVGSSRRKSFRRDATVGTSPSCSRSTLSPQSHRCLSCLVRTTELHRRNSPMWCSPEIRKQVCLESTKHQHTTGVRIGTVPFLFRNSTMSLNTMGIPQTTCPSALSVPKGTPNTHLSGSLGSDTRVGEMGSGLTFAVDLRILTEDGLLCIKTGQQLTQMYKSNCSITALLQ